MHADDMFQMVQSWKFGRTFFQVFTVLERYKWVLYKTVKTCLSTHLEYAVIVNWSQNIVKNLIFFEKISIFLCVNINLNLKSETILVDLVKGYNLMKKEKHLNASEIDILKKSVSYY